MDNTCYCSPRLYWQLSDWDHWEPLGHWCVTKLKTKNKLPRSARSKQLTLDFGPDKHSNLKTNWTETSFLEFFRVDILCWSWHCSVCVVTTGVTPAWLASYCVTPGLSLHSQPRYLWCKLYSEQGLVMSCKCSLSHFLHRHIILDKIKCGAPHNKGINRLASQYEDLWSVEFRLKIYRTRVLFVT